MTRQNLCTNPKAQIDVTGFQQSGADAPAQATGLSGFPAGTTAAQYTTGTYQTTSTGAASPGNTYIVSFYARSVTSAQSNKDLYINWILASGSSQPSSVKVSLSADTVTRVSISATAPSNTVGVGALIDGMNAALSTIQISDVLIEDGSTLNGYADGDTSGWAWDGTTGNSSSSESVAADSIAPSSLDLTMSFGEPSVSQAFTVAPSSLSLPIAFGQPSVSQAFTVAPSSLALPLSLGEPSVAAAFEGSVAPASLSLPIAFGEPRVRFTAPSGGSWEALRGIVAEARADHARNQERIQNPIDCPEHQWPLDQGPNGVLHCKFGGHIVAHGSGARD